MQEYFENAKNRFVQHNPSVTKFPDWFAADFGIIFKVFILVKRIVTEVCIRLMSTDVVFTGYFTSNEFQVYDRYSNDFQNSSPAQTILKSNSEYADGFVAKYTLDGHLRWTAKMEGQSFDIGLSNTLDRYGNVYTAGYFYDASLNVYTGVSAEHPESYLAVTLEPPGDYNNNAYLVKYNDAGHYQWANMIGPNIGGTSTRPINQTSTAFSNDNHIYLTTSFMGSTTSIYKSNSSTPLASINQVDSPDNTNVLLTKFDTNGNPVWVACVDGVSDNLRHNTVTVDKDNNSYLCMLYREVPYTEQKLFIYSGHTINGDGIITNHQLIADGSCNLVYNNNQTSTIIVKFDPNGQYLYTLQLGPEQSVGAYTNITTSNDGSLFITGVIDPDNNIQTIHFYDAITNHGQSIGIPVITITNLTINDGYTNMYIAKYDSAGQCLWVNTLAGEGYDSNGSNSYIGGYSNAVDVEGNSFTTGSFGQDVRIYPVYPRTYSGSAYNNYIASIKSQRAPETGSDTGSVWKNGFVVSYDNNGGFRWIVQLSNKEV